MIHLKCSDFTYKDVLTIFELSKELYVESYDIVLDEFKELVNLSVRFKGTPPRYSGDGTALSISLSELLVAEFPEYFQ